jgi:hypothetical protein
VKRRIFRQRFIQIVASIGLLAISACVTPEGKKPMSASQAVQIKSFSWGVEARCKENWGTHPAEKREEIEQLFEKTGQTLPAYCACISKRFVDAFDAELYDKFIADQAKHSDKFTAREPWKSIVVQLTIQCTLGKTSPNDA